MEAFADGCFGCVWFCVGPLKDGEYAILTLELDGAFSSMPISDNSSRVIWREVERISWLIRLSDVARTEGLDAGGRPSGQEEGGTGTKAMRWRVREYEQRRLAGTLEAATKAS